MNKLKTAALALSFSLLASSVQAASPSKAEKTAAPAKTSSADVEAQIGS